MSDRNQVVLPFDYEIKNLADEGVQFSPTQLFNQMRRGGDADEKLDRKGQKWEEDIRKKKKKRQSNYMKN